MPFWSAHSCKVRIDLILSCRWQALGDTACGDTAKSPSRGLCWPIFVGTFKFIGNGCQMDIQTATKDREAICWCISCLRPEQEAQIQKTFVPSLLLQYNWNVCRDWNAVSVFQSWGILMLFLITFTTPHLKQVSDYVSAIMYLSYWRFGLRAVSLVTLWGGHRSGFLSQVEQVIEQT